MHDLQINTYKPEISRNAIALLSMYGGNRELVALAELAAYLDVTENIGIHTRPLSPSPAQIRVREMYALD